MADAAPDVRIAQIRERHRHNPGEIGNELISQTHQDRGWLLDRLAVVEQERNALDLWVDALSAMLDEPPVAVLRRLLRRYLDNHCQASDQEGASALCECRLCLETRAALAAV